MAMLPLMGQVVSGPGDYDGGEYRIRRELGEGGFAVVYEADVLRWPAKQASQTSAYSAKSSVSAAGPDDRVAIKVIDVGRMDDQYVHLVMDEVRIHRKLSHPSIVRFVAAFGDERFRQGCDQHQMRGHFYLVMELCERGSLKSLLKKRGGCFSESEARDFVRQVGHGLHYLQQQNIIHRDLSLANVLVTKDGRYKICDFGLAKRTAQRDATHRTFCGTAENMAPETITRQGYGMSVDVFALGGLLYTLLVGHPPFNDPQTQRGTLERIVHQHPDYPTHLSQSAIHLVNQMLQKDTAQRISLDEVLRHPFVTAASPDAVSACITSNGDSGIGHTMSSASNHHGATARNSAPPPNRLSHLSEAAEFGGSGHIRDTRSLEDHANRHFFARSNSADAPADPYARNNSAPAPNWHEGLYEAGEFGGSSGDLRPRSATDASHDVLNARPMMMRGRSNSVDERSSRPPPPLAPPLLTIRLPPKRIKPIARRVSGGILSTGEVQFEFEIPRKNKSSVVERMLVSPDGRSILVDRGDGGTRYTYDTLDARYFRKYNFMATYVQGLRESTAKVTLYRDDAQCQLMENLPEGNVKVTFYTGQTVTLQADENRVTFQDESGRSETFPFPLDRFPLSSTLCNSSAVQYLSRFEAYYRECKETERANSSLRDPFPLVVGRRSTAARTNTIVSSTSTAASERQLHRMSPVAAVSTPQSSIISRASIQKEFQRRFKTSS